MRRDLIWIVLGLVLGAAPLAVGQGDEELGDRLRSLQEAVDKALHRAPVAEGLVPVNAGGYELAVIPVADLVAGLTDHIPPSHSRLTADNETPVFGGQTEEAPQPFGTIEELLELVRSSVWPEAWNEGGNLAAAGTKLIVLAKPAVVRDVRRFFDQSLRPRAHRSVTIEAEVLEVPHALYARMRKEPDAALGSATRHVVDEAIAAKSAKRLFGARVTGMAGQRVVAWHGKQVAALVDMDVEVADGSNTSDPVIDVVQSGGFVSARARPAGDPAKMLIEIEVKHDLLSEPIERRETEKNGVVDVPMVDGISSRATMLVPARTWVMVGTGTTRDDAVRVILARVTPLERQGGEK